MFIDAVGPLSKGGTGTINGLKVTAGDGYVRINARVTGGNYVYPVGNLDVAMGDGDSDFNVVVDGDPYYNAAGIQSLSYSAGGGSDVINVNMRSANGLATYWLGMNGSYDMGEGDDIINVYVEIPEVTALDSYATAIGGEFSFGEGDDLLRLYARDAALSGAIVDMGIGNDAVIIDRGISRGGNDSDQSVIDFGAGVDSLVLPGISSDYATEQISPDQWVITKPSDALYRLTVSGLESITFDDGVVNLAGDTLTIGNATSDASRVVISGDLTNPLVEAVIPTTIGKGKNKITVSTLSEVPIDQAGPLDALTVTGGDGNNTITGQGFADDPNTGSVNESRSAFSGVLVIDGKGGADSITGGKSGPNWLIGGGVSADGTVDTLTGASLATDVFDLRKEVAGSYQDAYLIGHAVINNFELGDNIVLSGSQSDYNVVKRSEPVTTTNKRGKVTEIKTITFFEIKDQSGDLLATVNGSGFTDSTTVSNLKIVYGQSTQSPFEVVLPGSNGGTII